MWMKEMKKDAVVNVLRSSFVSTMATVISTSLPT